MKVKIKLLHPRAEMPIQAHSSDFGYDVKAVSIKRIGFLTYRYNTGLSFQPEGQEDSLVAITARPRSSVWKTGMLLVNAPGTVDIDYTGEVSFVFIHVFPWRKKYQVGDKVGQIHLDVSPRMEFTQVHTLSSTSRGAGREGSSGK